MPEIALSAGTVRYRDEGSGPPVVLIHGLLVNGQVWDPVVRSLSPHARCIVPEMPLGSHRLSLKADADLSPPGLGKLIAELLDRLELEDVTLVGNDTGGALCQLAAADHPQRLGRMVLTNCDMFENFPPRAFRAVVRAMKLPGAVACLGLSGRLRPIRRAAMSMMPLTMQPIPDALVKSWIDPLRDRGVRRDLVRVLRGVSPEHTIAAAERLRGFDPPVLLVWGMQDRFFPLEQAQRFAAMLPRARIEQIENARTFVQLDAPDRLAELIREFAGSRAPAAAVP
jgi:pimeloyl-ACP methyl ester carboxylesterase